MDESINIFGQNSMRLMSWINYEKAIIKFQKIY